MFKTNDKVVCVNDSPGKLCRVGVLTKGRVYVVKHAELRDKNWHIFIVGAPTGYMCPVVNLETGWATKRFRLVSEVKMILALYNKDAIGKEVSTPHVAKP